LQVIEAESPPAVECRPALKNGVAIYLRHTPLGNLKRYKFHQVKLVHVFWMMEEEHIEFAVL
jgi:hypothetical protein